MSLKITRDVMTSFSLLCIYSKAVYVSVYVRFCLAAFDTTLNCLHMKLKDAKRVLLDLLFEHLCCIIV